MSALDPGARGLAIGARNAAARNARAARLHAAAERALAGNPLDLPPLTVPAAYANGTAYAAGQVIAGANGHWYVCVIGGTSAASGAGPSATNVANAATDGTAAFAYYSGPLLNANDPGAPAVVTTTVAPSDLGRSYSLFANPLPFSTRGIAGFTPTSGGAAGVPYTFTDGTGANVSGGVALGFETESASVAICLNQGGAPYRIMIDGRYHSIGSAPVLVYAGWTWVRFTFTGRKLRGFVIETGFAGNATAAGFGSLGAGSPNGTVRIDTNAQLRPLAPGLRMVAFSDSLCRGSDQGPMIPGNQVPLGVGKLLGIADVYNMSIGGTGWLARGSAGSTTGPQSSFRDRIPQGLALNPDIWLFGGSVNDGALPAASIGAEVVASIKAVRAGGSTAPIIMFGCLAAAYANAAMVEAAVLAGIAMAADPYTFWVPCATDPLGAWVDAGNAAMMATSGPHSTDFTLTYWARRLANAIRRSVYPRLMAS